MQKEIPLALIGLMVMLVAVTAQVSETSSIRGQVSSGGKPVANLTVILELSSQPGIPVPKDSFTARTNLNGQYEFIGLVKGSYLIAPRASQFALPVSPMNGRPGRQISLGSGEQITDIDFDLVPGGVITGKLTDNRNRPLIGQSVQLSILGPDGKRRPFNFANYPISHSDDRGIYRLFGLPAGRYLISVGREADVGFSVGGPVVQLPLTFYPGVASESEAKEVEVSSGKEATEINISVGQGQPGHTVRGRITDATTGSPLVNIGVDHGLTMNGTDRLIGAGNAGERTDGEGNFEISGLIPGRYALMVHPDSASDLYSDPRYFNIDSEDVDGIDLIARHGSTISGRIVLSENTDPALAKLMPQSRSSAFPRDILSLPFGSSTAPRQDGSFEIKGIRPGKILLSPFVALPLQVMSIESKGMTTNREIEVSAGEQVSGVIIRVGSGSGSIRGQVNIVNGPVAEGTILTVNGFRQAGAASPRAIIPGMVTVDARGHFSIDNLLPGTYQLNLLAVKTDGMSGNMSLPPIVKEVVVGAGETQVSFEITFPQKQVKQ